jgi:flagellar basal-body rod modification protein FlgD
MSDPIWSLVAGASTAPYSAAGSTARSAAQTGANSADAAAGLGKEAFMRLLLTQMQSQDPLSPMDGQAFFTQLAQLSLLEQMYQLNDTLNNSQRQQALVQAGTLIGRQVDYVGEDGSKATGIVKGVRLAEGQVLLDVNGSDVPMSSVSAVREMEES